MLDTGIDHRNQSQDVLGKDQHMGVTGIKLKGAFNLNNQSQIELSDPGHKIF